MSRTRRDQQIDTADSRRERAFHFGAARALLWRRLDSRVGFCCIAGSLATVLSSLLNIHWTSKLPQERTPWIPSAPSISSRSMFLVDLLMQANARTAKPRRPLSQSDRCEDLADLIRIDFADRLSSKARTLRRLVTAPSRLCPLCLVETLATLGSWEF